MSRIFALLLLAASATAMAQFDQSLSDFLDEALEERDAFRDKALAEHEAYRDSVFAGFSDWAEKVWMPKDGNLPQPKPHDDKPVPPVVVPEDEPEPQPKEEPVVVRPVVVIPPAPRPEAPKPVLPPKPELKPLPADKRFKFKCYGTEFAVQAPDELKASLKRTNFSKLTESLSSALKVVDKDAFDNLYTSLSQEAADHHYTDWAFMKLADSFSKAYLPGDENLQKILQSMLMLSAGYDIRLGASDQSKRVYMLAGFQERLIGQYHWSFGDVSYYPLEKTPTNMYITPESYPGTRPLSAQPSGKETFSNRPGESREVKICFHHPHCRNNNCATPALLMNLTGNLNRMDFYTDCPQFMIGRDENTFWHTYAGASLSEEMEDQLYSELRPLLEGKSKLEQVNVVMKFVEAFPYEYDDKVWGRDRAFFAEETLHYPFRDCEDGAVLFTRVVRDLIGLPTALLYYPGHLAAAVAFDTPVDGAFIEHGGRRYTVCDPTYYYVDAGVQMPKRVVDPTQAVLIPL